MSPLSDKQTDAPAQVRPRLMSLDLLRGLDIFILVVISPLFWKLSALFPMPKALQTAFTHAAWEGFHAWDLVMPLFIFMSGAAIPLSLPKLLREGRPTITFWKHILRRMIVLWILGMVVQGHLLAFDWELLDFYNNTLQAIAAGYLVSALALLIPLRYVRLALPFFLAAVYGLLLALCGDYTPKGNFALQIEHLLFPSNTDGYGWSLTSLMFGALALWGGEATRLLRSARPPMVKALLLFAASQLFLGSGLLLTFWEPAIKRIFTISFTLQAAGWSMLLLSVLYLFVDVLNFRRGWGLLLLFGRYSLWAYMLGTFWRPVLQYAANFFLYGVEARLSEPVYWLCVELLTAYFIIHNLRIADKLSQRHGGRYDNSAA